MPSPLPFAFPLDQPIILQKRAAILSALLVRDEGFCAIPVKSLRSSTLTVMLSLYDDMFLAGYLQKAYSQMEISCSSRLTSAAGKFIYSKDPAKRTQKAEIRMSSDFLFRLHQGPFELNGLCVSTPQEAFLIVFEHELCHALETALYGSTGHSKRFLSLACGLFGHTAIRHSLPTRKQEAAKEGFAVGSRASFPFEGKILTGQITYVGKTATVMVPSPAGTYRDRAGKRYAKYRVPLSQLQA